ncbi:MAG: hypothetical protein ACYC2K_10610, partial [Gemmatimonadales bacterium]
REIETATTWGIEHTEGALLLVLALSLIVMCWKRYPVVSFGLLWTAIGIFPVSNVLVPTGIVLAERTLFLGSIGMMLTVGGLAAPLIEQLRRTSRFVQVAACAAVLAVLVMGTTRSASRQQVWKTHFSFWYQTTIDAPFSYRAHHALGQMLYKSGAREWAEQEYQLALILYPKRADVLIELGDNRRIEGRCDDAIAFYRRAIALQAEHNQVRASVVACLMHQAEYGEAKAEAQRGLRYAVSPAAMQTFQGFIRIADSAGAVNAPPGTVTLSVTKDESDSGRESP